MQIFQPTLVYAPCNRYKESFSKGTKGIKEKLLARNSSVKELSKGVQREMSAGIAGVVRMIERLDLSSKRTGPSSPASGVVGETNLSSKGKGVQVNIITEELNRRNEEVANVTVLTASSHISDASPDRLEVSQVRLLIPLRMSFSRACTLHSIHQLTG